MHPLRRRNNSSDSIHQTRDPKSLAVLALLITLVGGTLACQALTRPVTTDATATLTQSLQPTETTTSSATASPSAEGTAGTQVATELIVETILPSSTTTLDPNLPVWQQFQGPALIPATAIPPPVSAIVVPAAVKSMILMGTNQESPFVGRTDAMMLLFYSQTTRRASILSIPADLFVYIPGYTMQRLQAAYAYGEIDGLNNALLYNLGIRADDWALIHPPDFIGMVDEVSGLDIAVSRPYPNVCGDLVPGLVHMYGEQILCYANYRQDMDELDRNHRQQQVVNQIFRYMVTGGNLVRLPGLYQAYGPFIQSSFSYSNLDALVPLTLDLGDPQQLGYFTLQEDDLSLWTLPGAPTTQVFLPRPGALPGAVLRSIDFVLQTRQPGPVVTDLVALLTRTPTLTQTATRTGTPTRTITLRRTITLTRTNTPKPTRTPTRGPTRTRTSSRTITLTRTITMTPTVTNTPTLP